MYPNPQDALALPPRPDLEQFRKRAKSLTRACRSETPAALDAAVGEWIRGLLDVLPPDRRPDDPRRVDLTIERVTGFARAQLNAECSLARAQFVMARVHGFASWPKLLHHIDSKDEGSADTAFEQAAEAIVEGRLEELRSLLDRHPSLIKARSDREHDAMLLHYVSANGVENYRQKTPPNIVEIARLLLDRGAQVDAEADVYGGGATTFGLVVTSAHPRARGVQIELAELLMSRGARVEPGIVRDCLANGCPEAANHLASRGVALSLEEAAGIGRVDIIESMLPTASHEQRVKALMMAAWYGQRAVIEALLAAGLAVSEREAPGTEGQTALHIAAYTGNRALVDFLLDRGAAMDVVDDRYRTTPLTWALHAWLEERRGDSPRHRDVVHLLIRRGSPTEPWMLADERIRRELSS